MDALKRSHEVAVKEVELAKSQELGNWLPIDTGLLYCDACSDTRCLMSLQYFQFAL